MALALLSPAGRRLPRFGGAEELCRRDGLRVEGTPCQGGDVFPRPFPGPPSVPTKHAGQAQTPVFRRAGDSAHAAWVLGPRRLLAAWKVGDLQGGDEMRRPLKVVHGTIRRDAWGEVLAFSLYSFIILFAISEYFERRVTLEQ